MQRLEHHALGVAARPLAAAVGNQEGLHAQAQFGRVLAAHDDLRVRDQLRLPQHLQPLRLGRKAQLEALEIGRVVGGHVGLVVGHGQRIGLVGADDLAQEARLHDDVVRQKELQLRHDEARHRLPLAARQPPAFGLVDEVFQRVEGRRLAREQQPAVAGQAVVPHDLGHDLHALLAHGVERHLSRQERHVDFAALDGLLQRLVRIDREHAHRPLDGAAEFGQQRVPVAARLEGTAQRQDAEAHRRIRGGCRSLRRRRQRQQQKPHGQRQGRTAAGAGETAETTQEGVHGRSGRHGARGEPAGSNMGDADAITSQMRVFLVMFFRSSLFGAVALSSRPMRSRPS
ncbi:hypothetical protein D9M68_515870 [compost metagenome]